MSWKDFSEANLKKSLVKFRGEFKAINTGFDRL